MSAELFEVIPCGDTRGPMLLQHRRAVVEDSLNLALRACDDVPPYYLDAEEAGEVFRHLADDGDDSYARTRIRECFEMDPGFSRHFETLMGHVDNVAHAHWQLHRAEQRAFPTINS